MMVKFYIFNKSNKVSKIERFQKVLSVINSELFLTCCTETDAVCQMWLTERRTVWLVLCLYLERLVELLDDFVTIDTLRLTDVDVTLGNLREPARAIFFVRQDGTSASDARRRDRLLPRTTNHFLLVEESRWNVVDLRWIDEARPTNRRFTTDNHRQNTNNDNNICKQRDFHCYKLYLH